MLIRCVVDDQFDQDFKTVVVRCGQELLEVVDRAVTLVNGAVVRDVVAVIP